jgi:signal peptidase I
MKFIREILVPLVIGLAIFILLQTTVGSFKVYGISMLPSIQNGEYILVNKAAYSFNKPQRGDIIVFRSPRDPNTDLIKRVIAVPGDTIEIKDNAVFVNGNRITEPYILEPPHYALPEQKIPADSYFVLGDNRNNSADSHRGWTVPRKNIIGRAWITYWPPQKWGLIEHTTLRTGKQIAKISKPGLTMETVCLTI